MARRGEKPTPAAKAANLVKARAARGPQPSKPASGKSLLGPGEVYEGEIDHKSPLTRLKGEGDNAYRAFVEFSLIPAGERLLLDYAKKAGAVEGEARLGAQGTIEGWSRTWRWFERLRIWDDIQLARDIEAAAQENFDARKRRRLLANNSLQVADLLIDYLLTALDDDILRRYLKASLRDVAAFVKMASDLSRTEHSEEGIPVRKVIVEEGEGALERATPDELAALLRRSLAERIGEKVLDQLGSGDVVEVTAREVKDDVADNADGE